jgi:hypothetical protein
VSPPPPTREFGYFRIARQNEAARAIRFLIAAERSMDRVTDKCVVHRNWNAV